MSEAQILLWMMVVGTALSLVGAGVEAWSPGSRFARVVAAIAHALPSINPKGVVDAMRGQTAAVTPAVAEAAKEAGEVVK